jgi:hypothetical protein
MIHRFEKRFPLCPHAFGLAYGGLMPVGFQAIALPDRSLP